MCLGLHYPLSYQYKYKGTIGAGVPASGPQYSASTIEMMVDLKTISSRDAVVKVSKLSLIFIAIVTLNRQYSENMPLKYGNLCTFVQYLLVSRIVQNNVATTNAGDLLKSI